MSRVRRKMELNKKNDWIGTYDEHLEKLLETHDCLCPKAREILEIIIKDMNDALHENDGVDEK